VQFSAPTCLSIIDVDDRISSFDDVDSCLRASVSTIGDRFSSKRDRFSSKRDRFSKVSVLEFLISF
jgi:hypothetical protein